QAAAACRPRSITGPTDGTCERPIPATTLDGILDASRGEERLVALAAHLRAHAVEAVAGNRADLEHEVDVHAVLDHAGEVAPADQASLFFRKPEAGDVAFFVRLKGGAVRGHAERCAQLVEPPAAARKTQVEDRRVGDALHACLRQPVSA